MFLELKKIIQHKNEKRNGISSPNLCFFQCQKKKKSTYIEHLQSYSTLLRIDSIIILKHF